MRTPVSTGLFHTQANTDRRVDSSMSGDTTKVNKELWEKIHDLFLHENHEAAKKLIYALQYPEVGAPPPSYHDLPEDKPWVDYKRCDRFFRLLQGMAVGNNENKFTRVINFRDRGVLHIDYCICRTRVKYLDINIVSVVDGELKREGSSRFLQGCMEDNDGELVRVLICEMKKMVEAEYISSEQLRKNLLAGNTECSGLCSAMSNNNDKAVEAYLIGLSDLLNYNALSSESLLHLLHNCNASRINNLLAALYNGSNKAIIAYFRGVAALINTRKVPPTQLLQVLLMKCNMNKSYMYLMMISSESNKLRTYFKGLEILLNTGLVSSDNLLPLLHGRFNGEGMSALYVSMYHGQGNMLTTYLDGLEGLINSEQILPLLQPNSSDYLSVDQHSTGNIITIYLGKLATLLSKAPVPQDKILSLLQLKDKSGRLALSQAMDSSKTTFVRAYFFGLAEVLKKQISVPADELLQSWHAHNRYICSSQKNISVVKAFFDGMIKLARELPCGKCREILTKLVMGYAPEHETGQSGGELAQLRSCEEIRVAYEDCVTILKSIDTAAK